MKINAKYTILAGLSISLLSCIKKEELPEKIMSFDNSTGIALINSEVSLFSVQDKVTIIQVGKDGVYEMLIHPGWFSFPTAENLIKIPSTFAKLDEMPSVPVSLSSPAFNLPSTVTNIPISFSNSATFSVSGTSLKKIYFKEGTIDLSLLHTLNGRSANPFSIEITNLTKADGSAQTMVLDGGTNINANALQNTSSSLAGYYLDLTGGEFLKVKLNVSFNAGSPVNGIISVGGLNFKGVKWSKLEANLGNSTIPVLTKDNQQEIDVFALTPFKSNKSNNDPTKTTPNGGLDFYFEGASVKLNIKNGFGIPLRYDVSPLRTIRKDNTVLELFNDPQLLDLQLKASRDNATPTNSVNGFLSSENTMSVSGTLMNNLLRYGPTKLGYGFVLRSEPTRPATTDFIYDTSSLKAFPEVKIPFKGYFKLYDIETVAKYPLAGADTTTTFKAGDFNFDINRASFGVKIENKLPMKFFMSVYFTEEDSSKFLIYRPTGLPADTVKLGPFIVDGATIDAAGKVNGTSIFNKVFNLERQKFVLLNTKCKKVLIVGRPETTSYPDKRVVQITPENKMGIKINIIADYKVSQK